MLPFLKPLARSLWLQIICLCIGVGIITGLGWILIDKYNVNSLYGILCLVIGLLIFTTFISLVITKRAVLATDFLAKAVLATAQPNSQVEAPNPDTLGPSRSFLADLAQKIYQLTSARVEVPGSGNMPPSFADNLPLPIIILDKHNKVVFINDLAAKYVAIKREDIMQKPIHDVMNLSFASNQTLEAWLKTIGSQAATTNQSWDRVRITLPDNSSKQFDMAAHYSKDDPHNFETTLIIFDHTRIYERDDHDLTFVSLAVHELRTPLTTMRGYIEVFEDELGATLNTEQKTFMHNMAANAQQLASFVANILNVVRIEEDALLLHLKEEKWSDVLLNACKDMDLRARVNHKKIVCEIAPDLPTVAVDKVSIYEVIVNLIDNAIKYTHTSENIVIKSYQKDGMIETTIADRGVGIAPSLIGHIFDKFYRAHQNKSSIGGTGLGLYLSHAIVAANGGTIWVQSKEGVGSTFGFTLPTYASVADKIKPDENGTIIRGAHGWIKNHSLYRG